MMALPLILPCGHPLASHPASCLSLYPASVQEPRMGRDQLLVHEGPTDICHRRGQERARLKVSPLPRRLEFKGGFRHDWGMGTSQESRTMAETHHTSCSVVRLRASRECQNVTADGRGAPGCSAPTPDRDWLDTYLVGVCQDRGCLTRCRTLERPP